MRQVTAYEAFGVFADYDGNAPDTAILAVLSTRKKAEELCDLLNDGVPTEGLSLDEGSDSDYGITIVKDLARSVTGTDGTCYGLSLPSVDGWDSCRRFAVKTVLVPNEASAYATVWQALTESSFEACEL